MDTTQVFNWHGFYEEVWNAETGEFLGTRKADWDGKRRMSVAGEQAETFTANFTLYNGPKARHYKASAQRPVRAMTRLFPICGRMRNDNAGILHTAGGAV